MKYIRKADGKIYESIIAVVTDCCSDCAECPLQSISDGEGRYSCIYYARNHPIQVAYLCGCEWYPDDNAEELSITVIEAKVLAEYIDMTFIQEIRNDTDIDSMRWLINMVHAYEKLCKYSGYVGLTDNPAEDDEEDDGEYYY